MRVHHCCPGAARWSPTSTTPATGAAPGPRLSVPGTPPGTRVTGGTLAGATWPGVRITNLTILGTNLPGQNIRYSAGITFVSLNRFTMSSISTSFTRFKSSFNTFRTKYF